MAKQAFTVHSRATPEDTMWPAGMKIRLAPMRKYLEAWEGGREEREWGWG